MMLREIESALITSAVAELCVRANRELPEDVCEALSSAVNTEDDPSAKEILLLLDKNQCIARETKMPVCQDTGMAVVFAEIGQDVHVLGNFEEAVNEGVRKGYCDGYLRKSVVRDPLRRVNTGDNTPAVLHVRIVPGSSIKLVVAPKGFGSENMSRLSMLTPAAGCGGVRDFVLDTVKRAGANPCPPMILGIGIGGDFERCAELAKRALLLPLGVQNADPYYAALEREWAEMINMSGIGPQGLGGKTTCLGLHILAEATHIAGLPVAVNISCHVTRHAETVL